jgi:hypothetical protein
MVKSSDENQIRKLEVSLNLLDKSTEQRAADQLSSPKPKKYKKDVIITRGPPENRRLF